MRQVRERGFKYEKRTNRVGKNNDEKVITETNRIKRFHRTNRKRQGVYMYTLRASGRAQRKPLLPLLPPFELEVPAVVDLLLLNLLSSFSLEPPSSPPDSSGSADNPPKVLRLGAGVVDSEEDPE